MTLSAVKSFDSPNKVAITNRARIRLVPVHICCNHCLSHELILTLCPQFSSFDSMNECSDRAKKIIKGGLAAVVPGGVKFYTSSAEGRSVLLDSAEELLDRWDETGESTKIDENVVEVLRPTHTYTRLHSHAHPRSHARSHARTQTIAFTHANKCLREYYVHARTHYSSCVSDHCLSSFARSWNQMPTKRWSTHYHHTSQRIHPNATPTRVYLAHRNLCKK